MNAEETEENMGKGKGKEIAFLEKFTTLGMVQIYASTRR